ncbi:MAG: hypothetical protein ACE5I7_15495 [Candidatus Binatia bacterium]
MPRSQPDKRQFINQLIASRNKGNVLELELIIQGKKKEAAKVHKATRKLSRRIDDMIAAAMRTWRLQASVFVNDMQKRNAALQAKIRDVKNKIKIAENVVKAVGVLDEAAALAAKAVGKGK